MTRPPVAVSVVVPAYREADNLPELLRRLAATLQGTAYEVIVVDDGSPDATFAVATAATDPRVRALRHPHQEGKTAALRTGFTAARGAVVAMIDADLQYDPEELPRFLERVRQGAPVVTALRDYRRYPWSRRLPSRCYNWLTSRLLGGDVRDHNAGLKAFRRDVVEALLDAVPWRPGVHRYLVAVASVLGYQAAELPVALHPRKHGRSSLSSPARLASGLRLLLQLTYALKWSG